MKDCIIWDKTDEKFRPKFQFRKCVGFDLDGDLFNFETMEKLDYLESFEGVGIEDIEGNKIYADSSIVEFENIGTKKIGYFNFNKTSLCYEIIHLPSMNGFAFEPRIMDNFKIIDTIQENKLGLII